MEGPANGHRTFFVSGSTDGLGLKCCHQLAAAAPAVADASKKRVIAIHGRNTEKIAKCKEAIEKDNEANAANFEVITFQADLSDITQVRRLGDELMAHFNEANPLDVFMSNASITDSGETQNKSACGKYDRTFMVNVIACHILLKKMLTTAPAAIPKRICVTSSGIHKQTKDPVDSGNFNYEKGDWSWFKAYSLSKLLEIMLTVAFFEKGLIPATTTVLTFCPGHIATNLGG